MSRRGVEAGLQSAREEWKRMLGNSKVVRGGVKDSDTVLYYSPYTSSDNIGKTWKKSSGSGNASLFRGHRIT